MFNYTQPPFFRRFYVVFQEETSLWWLRLLRPGFRHCYILAPLENNCWLELNPTSNFFYFTVHRFGPGYDYLGFLAGQGCSIAEAEVEMVPHRPLPLFFFNCVEFVKHALGINNRLIITPYQLWKYLKM